MSFQFLSINCLVLACLLTSIGQPPTFHLLVLVDVTHSQRNPTVLIGNPRPHLQIGIPCHHNAVDQRQYR